VRLRSSATAYFNRTPAGTGNQQKFTFSCWLKRGQLGVLKQLFSVGTSTTGFQMYFNGSGGGASATDAIELFATNATTTVLYYTSQQVLRDPSAWYHVVLSIDTTQATAGNRVSLWVNNQLVTITGVTSVAQNTNLAVNTTVAHYLGQFNSTNYLDGYMTEVNWIDGQALTPSSFGQINAVTGVWQPIKYTGTYGTNGFYLNFSDNSSNTATTIGKDNSGNSNNWTPNNISVTAGATYDSMVDSPTMGATSSNYATLNAVDLGYGATLSEANLKVSTASAINAASASTMALSTNTYWEVTIGSNSQVGLIWGRASDAYGNSSLSMFASGAAGSLINATRTLSATPSWSNGDTLGFAWNNSTRVLTLYQAGSATAVMTMTTPATGDPNVAITNYTSGAVMSSQVNFGQRPFSNTPPTGFVALNTQNLPTPTISNGANYMAATTYTGTGSSLTIANTVNGISFYPDFVWVKGRSGATDHALYDSVRGTTKDLASNTTAAETTQATGLTAFSSTGFTVGALAKMNTNAATYVGWQWLANAGSSSSNTSGSITSTVSAGATQGFSVVTYTGTGANATVGHGLGVAPKMIIAKCRNTAALDWPVYHSGLANAATSIYLNLTNAASVGGGPGIWNSTAPTSSVFSVGTSDYTNGSTKTYVAYCFAEVAGYSAFGSYTGNGSTDGPFVFTGFRPRWFLVKVTSGTTGSWHLIDTSRSPYNQVGVALYPDSSAAESSDFASDILSNGLKIRNTQAEINQSGATYIYAAFAENPFKNSLAR
jgi:hypothetical protein